MEENEKVNRELRIIRIILDEENIFGGYVTMELRLLTSEYNKKNILRCDIRRAMSRIVDEGLNSLTGTPSPYEFVDTPPPNHTVLVFLGLRNNLKALITEEQYYIIL
jgi:hypothetical protein